MVELFTLLKPENTTNRTYPSPWRASYQTSASKPPVMLFSSTTTSCQWPWDVTVTIYLQAGQFSHQGSQTCLTFLCPKAWVNIRPRFLLWICEHFYTAPPSFLFIANETVLRFSFPPFLPSILFTFLLLHILSLPVIKSRGSEAHLTEWLWIWIHH